MSFITRSLQFTLNHTPINKSLQANHTINNVIKRYFAVHNMSSDSELRDLISQNKSKLVIVDWSASWCGPCKQIAPIYNKLSEQYSNAVFIKCDVDELSSSASDAGVQGVPTFHFIKNDELVDEFTGADSQKVVQTIEKHQ